MSQGNSPTKSSGVLWFNQYLRSFVTPYGEAKVAPTPEMVFKSLKPFTAEWLSRPEFAISEYCDTITSNIALLEDIGKGILDRNLVPSLKDGFEDVMQHLQACNKRDPSSEATTEDAKKVLNQLVNNSEIDEMMDKLFQVGGALFGVACNHIVSSILLRHPEEFGEIVKGLNTKSSALFKEKPTGKNMKAYLLEKYAKPGKKRKLASRKASKKVEKLFIHSSNSSDSESDEDNENDKKGKQPAKKRKTMAKTIKKEKSESERESSSSSSDEETAKKTKEINQKEQKRKTMAKTIKKEKSESESSSSSSSDEETAKKKRK